MSDLNGQPSDDLGHATAALRDAPAPPGPPDDLTAATVAAVHARLAALDAAREQQRQRRRRLMRYIGIGTAAAAAVAVAVTLWSGGSSAAADVNKALEKAEKATSVKVRLTHENDGKVTKESVIIRQGDMARADTEKDSTVRGKVVMVVDLKTREWLVLLPDAKVAALARIGEQEYKLLAGMLGDFAGLKATLAADPKAVKAVGEEKLGGRETAVFEFAGETLHLANGVPFTRTWRVWVDPKTGFPVRLRKTDSEKGVMTLDYEEWNTKHDAKLFELKVPDGYELKEDRRKK